MEGAYSDRRVLAWNSDHLGMVRTISLGAGNAVEDSASKALEGSPTGLPGPRAVSGNVRNILAAQRA
jgi:hypothetical protein